MKWIKDSNDFSEIREKHKDYFILFFWGDFSEAAHRAISELKHFSQDYTDIPIYVVDVPTVLAIKSGKVAQFIEGAESAAFYDVQLGGAAPSHLARPSKRKAKRVTVYSGPGCPACGTLKTYLRRNGISFREVDIARDRRAAEKLVKRSGQMAVPQTDINGRLVVGFDQNKLDKLLGIQSERRET